MITTLRLAQCDTEDPERDISELNLVWLRTKANKSCLKQE